MEVCACAKDVVVVDDDDDDDDDAFVYDESGNSSKINKTNGGSTKNDREREKIYERLRYTQDVKNQQIISQNRVHAVQPQHKVGCRKDVEKILLLIKRNKRYENERVE